MMVRYGCSFPSDPFVPRPRPEPKPTPAQTPTGVEQEIGALKARVGRLEEEMREMAQRFVDEAKKGR
jgi:hypothetical protein